MPTTVNNVNMLNLTKKYTPMTVTKPVDSKVNSAKRLHSTSSHASSGVSSAGHSSHDRTSSRNNPSHDSDNSSQQLSSSANTTTGSRISKSSDEGLDTKIMQPLPEGFAEDRFRVDRKRLEMLLSQSIKMVGAGGANGKDSEKESNIKPLTRAEAFFLEVMNSTSTQVSWPSRLKVGAKSKKDPHIKITGPIEQVKIAKEKIMKQLDSKSSRVTIKMDVSHTDHSHVIGKGGSNIKHVMKETECHIHFPDSNRNQNVTEKSNQVSIAGQASGVELARQRIRDLLPITLFFEFPSKHLGATGFDINSPAVQNIVQTYNISIQAKTKKPYTTIFQIRGCVSNQIALKDGVICLMQILTGQLGQTIPVCATLEIQNVQSFMNAKSVAKIKAIQANTGVTIEFPTDKKSSTIEALTNACDKVVAMTGSCEGVLFARQEIISHLPLVLMFDLKDDVSNMEAQSIGDKFECFISIKAKNKQATKSCIIKSSEANVYNMFKARQALMKIPFNGLEDIPMPINTASFLFSQKMQTVAGLQAAAMVQQAQQKVVTQNGTAGLAAGLAAVQQQTQAAMHQQSSTAVQNSFVPNWKTGPASPQRKMQINAKSINSSSRNSSTPSSDSANGSTSTRSVDTHNSSTKMSVSNIIRQPNGPPGNNANTQCSNFTIRNTIEVNTTKTHTGIKIASIQNRQGSCHSSKDDCSSGNDCTTTSDISEGERVSHKPIVSESYYKPSNEQNKVMPTFNGRQIILNSINKGNVLSKSSNCYSSTNLSDNSSEQVTSKNTIFASNNNTNNVVDSSVVNTNNTSNNNNKYVTSTPKDLSSLFAQLNLDKYIESFLDQEIDLQTFSTMTDNDLREMGVCTFGARRKMSMAIKELNSGKASHVSSANISLKIGK